MPDAAEPLMKSSIFTKLVRETTPVRWNSSGRREVQPLLDLAMLSEQS